MFLTCVSTRSSRSSRFGPVMGRGPPEDHLSEQGSCHRRRCYRPVRRPWGRWGVRVSPTRRAGGYLAVLGYQAVLSSSSVRSVLRSLPPLPPFLLLQSPGFPELLERTRPEMAEDTSRRDFIRQVGAGAVAAASTVAVVSQAQAAPTTVPYRAKSRILGANDRINVGFVGLWRPHELAHHPHRQPRQGKGRRAGGRRQRHLGQAQAAAAREKTGVDEKSVYHDYRELCARPDIDAVVISSPDHWHYAHAMAALENGKDVYLEKPMTYTVDEAKKIAEYVKSSGRIMQVGSQYTSLDHFHKARKVIEDGLIGEVVWASGGLAATARSVATSGTTGSIPTPTSRTSTGRRSSARRRSAPSTRPATSGGGSTGTTPAALRPTSSTTRSRPS